jgi:hypothetical protein
MMTYGWAILIIVIVAVILYSMGIFNPASSISSTITGFSATPVSNAICTANGVLRIAVGDTVGHRILIKNISATSNGKTEVFTPTSTVDPNPIITSGNTYIFSIPNVCPAAGTRFSANVNINYTEPTTSFSTSQYTSTGTVTGTVSSTIMFPFMSFFDGVSSNINSTVTSGTVSYITLSAWINIRSVDPCWKNIATLVQSSPLNIFGEYTGCSAYVVYRANSTLSYSPAQGSVGSGIGKFVFIVVEWNGNNKDVYIFDNSSTVYNSQNTLFPAQFSINYIDIGGATTSIHFDNTWGFNGTISNVQLYSDGLSPSQMSQIHKEGIFGRPLSGVGLIGWWPLNGTAKDYSGNGNNGVATNIVYTSNYPTTGLS